MSSTQLAFADDKKVIKVKKTKKPKNIIFIIEDDNTEIEFMKHLDDAGIPKMVSILGNEFKTRVSNIKCSSIPLEKRKELLKNTILSKCITIDIKQKIIDTYFTKKEVAKKDISWLDDFTVGEEVLITNAKKQNSTLSKCCYSNIVRKAKIAKINKSSISVGLFAYTEKYDIDALQNQTYGSTKLIWNSFTNDSQIVYDRRDIIKKGECSWRENIFEEGEINVDYGR